MKFETFDNHFFAPMQRGAPHAVVGPVARQERSNNAGIVELHQGRLAQSEERYVHIVEVVGSRPASPTNWVESCHCARRMRHVTPSQSLLWEP
jgi:hypothetical protein